MSNVNYSLNNRGVRLVDSKDAWVLGKNKKPKLNPKYTFIGKVDMSMPNMILSATDKKKPTYKGDVKDLNRTAKEQFVSHFFNSHGKRNSKSKAYFAIEKKSKKF